VEERGRENLPLSLLGQEVSEVVLELLQASLAQRRWSPAAVVVDAVAGGVLAVHTLVHVVVLKDVHVRKVLPEARCFRGVHSCRVESGYLLL